MVYNFIINYRAFEVFINFLLMYYPKTEIFHNTLKAFLDGLALDTLQVLRGF